MIVRPDQVAAGIKRLWDAEPQLVRLVPGGLHWERVDAEASKGSPYAVLKVTEGNPEFFSGRSYLQPWTVELRVWAPNAGPVGEGGISRVLNLVYGRDQNTVMQVEGAEKVVDIRPEAGELLVDDARKDATDVMVCAKRWEVTIQAKR